MQRFARDVLDGSNLLLSMSCVSNAKGCQRRCRRGMEFRGCVLSSLRPSLAALVAPSAATPQHRT